jgi:hypothetical protein
MTDHSLASILISGSDVDSDAQLYLEIDWSQTVAKK